MKNNCFIYLLFYLFLTGCMQDPVEAPDNPRFTIKQAKSFFEEHATDLQRVRFGTNPTTRSEDDSNIIPDWQAARIFQKEKITTVEIPLKGDVCKIARTTRMGSSNILYGFTTKVTMKLIVQKHIELEQPRQFVVTMVDGISQSSQETEIPNCYGPSDFTGYVIVSSLSGQYLDAFQSENGCWRKVFIAPGSKEDLQDTRNAGINLLGANASPATYDIGESGSAWCPKCENVVSMCTCCKYCDGEGCDECMATVYPTCPKCGYTGPGAASGSCYCCPICHNYPCICYLLPDPEPEPEPEWKCPKCGSPFCNGNCSGGGEPVLPEPDECHHKQCQVCGKMIRTSTEASVCIGHEYCENGGMCVDVQVTVSKKIVTLGDTYTITINLTPQNTDCYDITYYIIENGQEYSLIQPDGRSKTLTTMARMPGNFQIKAEIMQNETYKVYSGITTVTHIFPSRDEILQQQVVIDGIQDAWDKTLASVTSSTTQEYGGIVMLNTTVENTGSLYQVEQHAGQPAPYSDRTTTVTVPWEDFRGRGPELGGKFAVLHFHTHPPLWEYNGNDMYKRPVGPSGPDLKNELTIPAVVKDFQHPEGEITTQTPRSEYENTEKLYYYGPDRRIF